MTIDLNAITLHKGAHRGPEEGHCLLEVVSMLAGKPFNDHPPRVAGPLREYGIGLNDAWDDAQRQKLLPFAPRLLNTAGDGQDEARSYLALDWLIRTYAPAWLDLAGLSAEAQELRSLRRIADMAAAKAAEPAAHRARAAGDAARAAAGAAAWAAAWAAAGDAAGDAARAAAWAAAGDAAWAAAWAAAWDAARDAARAAAWAAARAAAWAAAWDAAGDAAGAAARDAARDAAWDAARAAARAAARDALRPTVEALQQSALELFDKMINPENNTEGDTA